MKNQHFQGTGGASEDYVAQTLFVFMCFAKETEEGDVAYLVGRALHI